MNCTRMKRNAKKILARAACLVSVRLYLRLSYLHNRGKWPDLAHPKDLSEIVLASIASGKVKAYADYADKLKVREYYTGLGYGQYLPKLYGVWNSAAAVDFSQLPEAFALKTNHGCGGHYICRDRALLDEAAARCTIAATLDKKMGRIEAQYAGIKPKVYGEEYIDDGSGQAPSDFKFMCVDGAVKCILVVTDRTASSYKLITYDPGWRKLDYVKPAYATDKDFVRPANYDKMLEIARRIAVRFDFVRVDFYEARGRLILGELTFTPEGGIMAYFTTAAIRAMGRS